jgi:hypothetical protein
MRLNPHTALQTSWKHQFQLVKILRQAKKGFAQKQRNVSMASAPVCAKSAVGNIFVTTAE